MPSIIATIGDIIWTIAGFIMLVICVKHLWSKDKVININLGEMLFSPAVLKDIARSLGEYFSSQGLLFNKEEYLKQENARLAELNDLRKKAAAKESKKTPKAAK